MGINMTKSNFSAWTAFQNTPETDSQPEVWHIIHDGEQSFAVMAQDPMDAIEKAHNNPETLMPILQWQQLYDKKLKAKI